MTGRITHGHTRYRKTTPEFRTWCAMRQRCNDPNASGYPKYGAKGIQVCERWNNSFEAFFADMGSRPPGTTLDRKDGKGNYEPGNCRWATAKEQAANRTKEGFRFNATKTHCPQGHEYAGNNLHITPKGHRKCKECDRLRAIEIRKNKK